MKRYENYVPKGKTIPLYKAMSMLKKGKKK